MFLYSLTRSSVKSSTLMLSRRYPTLGVGSDVLDNSAPFSDDITDMVKPSGTLQRMRRPTQVPRVGRSLRPFIKQLLKPSGENSDCCRRSCGSAPFALGSKPFDDGRQLFEQLRCRNRSIQFEDAIGKAGAYTLLLGSAVIGL